MPELEQDLIEQQNTLDELNGELSDLESAKDGYYTEREELRPQVTEAQQELTRLQQEIERTQNNRFVYQNIYGEKAYTFNQELAKMAGLNQQLLTNNQNLASKEKQLERIDNLDAGKLNDLDAQLKNVDQILLNIEDSLTFVEEERNEAKEQLDEKNAEIERLEESLDAPAKPELSGRPDDGSTMEELQEQYDQIIADDEAAAEEEWYPGR